MLKPLAAFNYHLSRSYHKAGICENFYNAWIIVQHPFNFVALRQSNGLPQLKMNYLAHAYLSFGDPEILAGNMISDFVKGKTKYNYPAGIQKGIALHRAIDEFTDSHEATRKAKSVFRPAYRLYSAAFVDVVYDHFLATDTGEFQKDSLKIFSENVYNTLNEFQDHMPEKFARMFPYMKSQDWLFNYSTLQGTAFSFGGLVRRSLYLSDSDTAYRLFTENYSFLRQCYTTFFGDVKSFAYDKFQKITLES